MMLTCRFYLAILCLSAFAGLALPAPAQDDAPQPPVSGKKAQGKLNLPGDLGFGLPGLGAGGEGDVKLSASYKIVRGTKQGKLSVKAEIAPGWHIYSLSQPDDGPQKSELKIEDTRRKDSKSAASFTIGEFEPDSQPKRRKVPEFRVLVEEHEGEVTWTAPLSLTTNANPEQLPIKLLYSGQVCEDLGQCIPIFNRQVEVKFGGFIEPPRGEYRPATANMTWKGHLEPKVVAPGSKARLVLTATPDEGWHFYPYATKTPKQTGSRPTLVVLSNAATWRQYGVKPSASPKYVPAHDGADSESYYDDPVTFTIDLVVPQAAQSGKATLTGFLGFQTCEKTCLPPSGAKFTVTVPIAEAEEAGTLPLDFEEAEYKRASEEAAKAAPAYGEFDLKWHGTLLLLSLVGGFLLNLMPCVLPVLGLKILSFVQQGGKSRFKVLLLNFWYTLGLLAVFMVLATLSAFLNLGWGEQMTETWFRVAMLVMTFAFGLSFLGVWEIPIPGFASEGKASELQSREGASGAFFKGIFTTVLGISCSGPFLGGVFGLTLTQPPLVTYLIFLCVGIGMASPFLLVGLMPQTQRLLPKPGEWMNVFKNLMGFVMLAVAVWLFSTIGADNYIPSLALLVGVGFACWWVGRVPPYEPAVRQLTAWAGATVVAVAVGYGAFALLGPIQYLYKWEKYTPETLAKLQAEGKTVMVDFTADWCANCHLNMRWAINTRRVKGAVEKNGVVAVVADWSDKNETIKAKLAELNSRSIPVLAIYPAGKPDEVIILRDIVTARNVVDALEKAGPSKDVAAKKTTAGTSTADARGGKPRPG